MPVLCLTVSLSHRDETDAPPREKAWRTPKDQDGINASKAERRPGRFGAGRAPISAKQSVFDLNGCGRDTPAALGGEDHQLRGMLPRTALLNMLGGLRMNARTSSSVTSPRICGGSRNKTTTRAAATRWN
jgi:hypothetical protein